MSGSKHVGMTPGIRITPPSLAVSVSPPRSNRGEAQAMIQIIEQVLAQCGVEFYCLPDHTRTLFINITDSHGEALVPDVMHDDVGTHTLTTFRKSGVMEIYCREWVEVPPGEYSVVVQAYTMVLHNMIHEPNGRDKEAYSGGFPLGYLYTGGFQQNES